MKSEPRRKFASAGKIATSNKSLTVNSSSKLFRAFTLPLLPPGNATVSLQHSAPLRTLKLNVKYFRESFEWRMPWRRTLGAAELSRFLAQECRRKANRTERRFAQPNLWLSTKRFALTLRNKDGAENADKNIRGKECKAFPLASRHLTNFISCRENVFYVL